MKLTISVKPEGTTIEISGGEVETKKTVYVTATKNGVDKVCLVCGKTFSTKHPLKKVCSAACAAERQRKYAKKNYRLKNKQKIEPIILADVAKESF